MHRKHVFIKRIDLFQSALSSNDAFFTENQADIYYLTGCTGSNNHLLILKKDIYLFTDGRYISQIKEQQQINLSIKEISASAYFKEILAEILQDYGINCLKFMPDTLSYRMSKILSSSLPDNAEMQESFILSEQRSYKDELEVELIRRNLLITKAAFLYIQKIATPGVSELEVASELEYYCRKQGAEDMAFKTIVASGERGSLPHGIASKKILQKNELIQFDFGIIKDMYCSDFSRTIILGDVIHPKLDEIHQIVEDALMLVVENAKYGMTGQEIDAIAREYIEKEGFGDYFVHGLGHGLGLEIHENPRLTKNSTIPILENMVVTIEPGIYLPGIGGVRLEDVVVMRKDGFEMLVDCGYNFHE